EGMRRAAALNTLKQAEHLSPHPGDYLGPAFVREVEPLAVHVELPDGGAARATLAFALPYRPAGGDGALVLGKAEAYYAIGVLQGSGRTSLALHGDVELSAIDGRLRLSGDKGVELSGPEVDVQAGKLRMIADAFAATFTSVTQRVRSILSVHA